MRVPAGGTPVALDVHAIYRAPTGRHCRLAAQSKGRAWADLAYCDAVGAPLSRKSSVFTEGFTLTPPNFWLLVRVR